LFEGLIRQQGFVDGNKRTAILATHAFLRLNGYDFRPSKGELLRYTQEIANEDSGPELERVAAMIENNSAPLDE
jgi:death-on-curing family protein